MNRPPRPTQSRGYTLMELMVAIGITVMLMVLVQQLFRETTRAVNVGVQTSQILTQAEAISTQIKRDADLMLGPSQSESKPAGYLVIVNRRIEHERDENENIVGPLHIRSRRSALVEYDHNDVPRGYRADQIIFIAGEPDQTRHPPFRSLTPKSPYTLGSDIEARFARVWLGHAVQAANPEDEPRLGQRGTRNEWPNDWVLARHALLLTQDGTGAFDLDVDPDIIHSPREAGARWYDFSHEVENSNLPAGPHYRQLIRSLTDVADTTREQLIGDIEDGEDNGGHYLALARATAVPPSHFRVFVNQIPDLDEFASWQIAQMHPVLSGHVSDFIVEFAGDYREDQPRRIDRDDNGNVIWYSHFDNRHDNGGDLTRPHVWGVDEAASELPFDPDRQPLAPGAQTPVDDENEWYYWKINDDTAVFVWRHDDVGASDSDEPSMWPHMIRIRYRLQDPRGDVRGTVQYIDEDGEQASVDEPGQWFEQIIAVPRP